MQVYLIKRKLDRINQLRAKIGALPGDDIRPLKHPRGVNWYAYQRARRTIMRLEDDVARMMAEGIERHAKK